MNSNSWWSWFQQTIQVVPPPEGSLGNGAVRFIPDAWMTAEMCRTLSFMLLHSLWQGVLLGGILWICLRCIRAQQTSLRYTLSSLFLLSLVVCTALTGAILNLPPREQLDVATVNSARAGDASPRTARISSSDSTRPARSDAETPSATATTSLDVITGKPHVADQNTWPRSFAWGWLLGSGIMLLRIGHSLVQTRQLVQTSSALPAELVEPFRLLVDGLRQKLHLDRQIRIVCSDWINVPAVCGTVWPVLLMPTAMLTGIPLEQWRVILAHELAHIRRHDYFVNVLQMLVESVFFFNPAVWWISRQMRIEREACCDATAVEVTGQPLAVARALVNIADWVQGGRGQTPKTLVAWQSIDGNQAPGELTERVKRIAQPGMAPQLRLPWYSVLGILFLSPVLFLSLQHGARVAVQAAVQMLSPQERVEKLIAVDQQMAQEAAAANGITPDPTGKNPPQAQAIKITGVMKTADGLPLPVGAYVQTAEFRKNSTGNSGGSSVIKSELQHPFEMTCHPPCQVFLIGQAEGYAPAIVGPISLKPGQSIDPVHVVFERGTPSTIRLVDSQKNPIAGVKVSGSLLVTSGGGSVGSKGIPDMLSDEQGLVKLEGVQSKFPYQFKFSAPNFQEAPQSLLLSANKTIDVELRKARPATGQLVAAESGVPVAGAELLLVAAIRDISPNHQSSDGPGDPREGWQTSPSVMANTDAEGRYSLTTLTNNVRYQIYVRTRDFRPAILNDVIAGESSRVTRLQSPLIVKGKVLGAKKLPKKDGGTEDVRMLDYKNLLRTGENGTSYNYILRAPVKLQGDVGEFELRELFPGQVTLILGSRQQAISLDKSVDGFVIDLNLAPPAPKTRKVIFQLSGLTENNPVSGKLKLTWYTGDQDFHEHYIPVEKEGRAEADLPIGLKVDVWGASLIGCWMKTQPTPVIPEGSVPFEVNLPAIPAGAIQGRVLNIDGTPCESFEASVVVTKTPASMQDDPFLTVEPRAEVPGKFLFQQLPLGGEYQILIRSRDPKTSATRLSDPVALDAANPLANLSLRFPPGEKLAVRVLDETQRPAENVEIFLEFTVKGDRVSRDLVYSRPTDKQGLATFEHLNWNVQTRSLLTIRPSSTQTGKSIPMVPGTQGFEVQLERGLAGSGVLVDTDTGEPFANRKLRIAPTDYSLPGYFGWIDARTDEQGKFSVQNLEPREYKFYIDGIEPVNGPTESPGEFPTLVGGSEAPVRIEGRVRTKN